MSTITTRSTYRPLAPLELRLLNLARRIDLLPVIGEWPQIEDRFNDLCAVHQRPHAVLRLTRRDYKTMTLAIELIHLERPLSPTAQQRIEHLLRNAAVRDRRWTAHAATNYVYCRGLPLDRAADVAWDVLQVIRRDLGLKLWGAQR